MQVEELGAQWIESLHEDLRRVVEKYRAQRGETFVGASVCVSDSQLGALVVGGQAPGQAKDAFVHIAAGLLDTVLDRETNPDVAHLVREAERLLTLAMRLKTGQFLNTASLH